MIQTITYALPDSKAGQKAFAALTAMLEGTNAFVQNERLVIAPSPVLQPATVFTLDKPCPGPRLILEGFDFCVNLPDSLLSPKIIHVSSIPFTQAAEKLAGHILRVDHTGLVVHPANVPAADWAFTVETLGAHTCFYDYPMSPEHDPTQARGVFVIPATENEYRTQPYLQCLRQPKFELHCSAEVSDGTVLQIDMETKLTSQEICTLFPSSYTLPGLEAYFRSVNVDSPWPGISYIRLDMRPNCSGEIGVWNSGQWMIENGQRIGPNPPQAKLPPFPLSAVAGVSPLS